MKVLPMEEAILEGIQDENIQSEQKSASTLTPNTHDNVMPVGLQGRLRKKQEISKASLIELSGADEGVCAIVGQQEGFPKSEAMLQLQCWDKDIVCDLCHHGPSLSLGEWYFCCCGSRLQDCSCGVISSKHDNNGDECSGKAHKMCALWSIKVINRWGEGRGADEEEKSAVEEGGGGGVDEEDRSEVKGGGGVAVVKAEAWGCASAGGWGEDEEDGGGLPFGSRERGSMKQHRSWHTCLPAHCHSAVTLPWNLVMDLFPLVTFFY